VNRLFILTCVATVAFSGFALTQVPQTAAERSDYQETTRHSDVIAFCEQLAKLAPQRVRYSTLGETKEKRPLPLLILADPPIATAAEAADSGKLIVFVQANIHAGEMDGKEALLMLAREFATAKEPHPLFKKLILAFAPNVNPDGNEKLGNYRPHQPGPAQIGTRTNADGLDLNRDFIKLESPEVQAIVRFYRTWNPALSIDLHTTNGSLHQYTLTYDAPRHAATSTGLVAFAQNTLLPAIRQKFETTTKFKCFHYGNFNTEKTEWQSYPAQARYGTQYAGLRGRLSILSESYAYASYLNRITASREFTRASLQYAADNADAIRKVLSDADKPSASVALTHRLAARKEPVTIPGFEEKRVDGKRVAGAPKDYRVSQVDVAQTVLSRPRPIAYLVPPGFPQVIENLQRHGISLEEMREDIELTVESERILKLTRSEKTYQGHAAVKLETETRPSAARMIPAGTIIVRTNKALGTLASLLLEPASEDGLATWNFFDAHLGEGKEFPVLRLSKESPVLTTSPRPLKEDRVMNRRISATEGGGRRGGGTLAGIPTRMREWLPDGEHYIQMKQGQIWKVHAATGRLLPFMDTAKLKASLGKLPGITQAVIDRLPSRTDLQFNKSMTAMIFENAGEIYYTPLDGTTGKRLTASKGNKELVTLSPTGDRVAFVRDSNLFVVDVASTAERKLTADGGGLISNGKADWVYFEEIFNRSEHAFWWSPDSKHIAFLRFDDAPVAKFSVVDHLPTRLRIEQTPYPKAGDPNPLVRLGIANVDTGNIHFADLAGYDAASTLLVRACWPPDGKRAYLYVQDRAQTWLDVVAVPTSSGPVTKLLRDQTKAWVDDPGEPQFLKDGSFLLPSERTGWRHLYHFNADGKLLRQVTDGPWEMRTVHRVDEDEQAVYFSGTGSSHIALGFYKASLSGGVIEKIGAEPGDHRVRMSPKGPYFEVSNGSHQTPAQVTLKKLDGSVVRRLDTNPLYLREEYRLGDYRLVQIPMKDGFVLEGSVLLPVEYDPKQKYPVWFMTYAGPHAPTISDTWGARTMDHLLSGLGIIVFRCDPRSASGKGAASTWTAYKQLGVQEMKDIEEAIDWLIKSYPVDPTRIGMSGHSYGGFMTAYAMTHSKKFCAGIAGAPVTDWKNYDSIYTERYMDTPQKNPEGYARTSVVRDAGNLNGRLLLIHGFMDDNVHVQNSVQLIDALQRARKDFDMMLYPRARHGIGEPHYQKLMMDFIRKSLGK
jgi:dipeptidyl aminopeptidase/acylaminoacyl peptidase